MLIFSTVVEFTENTVKPFLSGHQDAIETAELDLNLFLKNFKIRMNRLEGVGLNCSRKILPADILFFMVINNLLNDFSQKCTDFLYIQYLAREFPVTNKKLCTKFQPSS